jgi:C_GCAxxG_C_C family probable redox protein
MGRRTKLKRRNFIIQFTALSLGSMTLGACFNWGKGKNSRRIEGSQEPGFENSISRNREMPRDLLMKLLDQKVNHYMEISNNCAQSSYLALTEQFEINGEEVLKALTPLPGIAERGETCGALIGPLIVFGQIYGRGKNRLHDWNVYRDSLIPSGKFCKHFEQELGSTMCHDIQEIEFGRSFQLTNPEDLRAFQEADATGHCSSVVRRAVRMAADIILNDQNTGNEV